MKSRTAARLGESPYVMPTPTMVVIMATSTLFAAAVRAFDYMLLPQNELTLTHAEQVLSLTTWGSLLLTGILLSIGGYIIKRWPVTILGHTLLAGIFIAFGVSLIFEWPENVASRAVRDGIAFICLQGVLHLQLAVVAWRRWDQDGH